MSPSRDVASQGSRCRAAIGTGTTVTRGSASSFDSNRPRPRCRHDESSDYRRRYRLGPISLGASSCRDRGPRLRGTRATVRKSGPTPAPWAWASVRSLVTGGPPQRFGASEASASFGIFARCRNRDGGNSSLLLRSSINEHPERFDRNHPAGLMFGFRRKKLSGSYFFFSAANRP
jgi:hypothetical protein